MPVPFLEVMGIYSRPKTSDMRVDTCLKIGKGKMTRSQWCKELGITRRTLHRWEQEIVYQVLGFKIRFAIKANKSKKYDEYQRFILLLVSWVLSQVGTYEETVNYFNQKMPDGREMWRWLEEKTIMEYLTQC